MIAPVTLPVAPAAAAQAAALDAVVPVLRTERCRLRAPRLGDFDALHSITGSDRPREGGPSTEAQSWADFCSMTATWMLRGHGMWTIELRDGAVAGFVFIGCEPGDEEHELGWLLVDGFEGAGLATEAARAARAFAWTTLGVPSLVSYIAPGHTRSEALASRLGATRDGTILSGRLVVWRHAPGDAA